MATMVKIRDVLYIHYIIYVALIFIWVRQTVVVKGLFALLKSECLNLFFRWRLCSEHFYTCLILRKKIRFWLSYDTLEIFVDAKF